MTARFEGHADWRRSTRRHPIHAAVIEGAIAGYLEAEKKLGRVSPNVDTKTLALTLVGSVHHLVFTQPGQPLVPLGNPGGSGS